MGAVPSAAVSSHMRSSIAPERACTCLLVDVKSSLPRHAGGGEGVVSLCVGQRRQRRKGRHTQSWATNGGVQQRQGGSGVEVASRCESVVDIRMEGEGASEIEDAHTPTLQQVDHLLMLHSACHLHAIPLARIQNDICSRPLMSLRPSN